jgi:hypothetical protein
MLCASRGYGLFSRRKERLEHVVAENDEGRESPQPGRDWFVAMCTVDALHEVLGAKLLHIVGGLTGRVGGGSGRAEAADLLGEIGRGEAARGQRQGHDGLGGPTETGLVEVDPREAAVSTIT